MERTKKWRNREDSDRNQLFLSYVEPHKPVVSCTVAGWLVSILHLSGIDTEKFKAHSYRGASTSKAKAKGLSCKEIMEMARWKKASTFKRHYLKEIVHRKGKQFQQTVLS